MSSSGQIQNIWEITDGFWDYYSLLVSSLASFSVHLRLLLSWVYSHVSNFLHSTWDLLDFLDITPAISDSQIQLLQILTAILFTHILLIYFAWKKYGDKITERFLKQAISAAAMHEQLRRAAKELKLPEEHTPRF